MKRFLYSMLGVFIALCLSLALTSCDGCNQYSSDASILEFSSFSSKGTCEVTGIKYFFGGEIVIPPTSPNGYTVIGIDSGAFKNSDITGVTIPDSVKFIRESAFRNCKSLESVSLGDGVTEIHESAFTGCDKLLYNEYGNAKYLGVGDNPYAFLIRAADENIASCEIHANTKYIASGAFAGCEELTSIVVPEGVIKIASRAFAFCNNLKNVSLPESLETLGNESFFGCTALVDVNIPPKIETIYGITFAHCRSLKSFTVPEGVTRICDYAFWGCTELIEITLPITLTEIYTSAFDECTSLENIYIGKSELGDEYKSPSDYKSLNGNLYLERYGELTLVKYAIGKKDTTFTVPSGVTSIGHRAFYGCKNLQVVTISSQVKVIETSAFESCTELAHVVFTSKKTLTTIEGSAFMDCINLLEIELPDKTSTIGFRAFAGCLSLERVKLADNMKTIGDSAFWRCENLTEIILPSNVKRIKACAFDSCSALTKITIPKSVENIEASAFRGCTSLSEVCYQGNRIDWEAITIEVNNQTLTSADITFSSLP